LHDRHLNDAKEDMKIFGLFLEEAQMVKESSVLLANPVVKEFVSVSGTFGYFCFCCIFLVLD